MKIRLGLVCLATALGLGVNGATAEELTIGALLPLTGPAAPIGLQQMRGTEFAVELFNEKGGLNGVPVQTVIDDSQGKPDQGVLAFNRLADLQNVPVTLTAYSSISMAIAPLATRRELLVINPAAQTNGLENASPYLLNTIPLVGNEAEAIAKYTVDNLGTRAAVVYENAAAGISSRDDFVKAFKEAGGEIVSEEPVEFGQTNYRAALLKTVAVKPDVVYFGITQSYQTMVDQVEQTPHFPIGVGTTFSSPFYGHKATEGWVQAVTKSAYPAEDLHARFNEKYGTAEMEFFAREYFNSTNIILQAAQHVVDAGKELTGTNLRDAIFEIGTFSSDVAEIKFEGSNTAKRPIEIQEYTAEGRKVIDTISVE